MHTQDQLTLLETNSQRGTKVCEAPSSADYLMGDHLVTDMETEAQKRQRFI